MTVLNVYKPPSITPLQLIQMIRQCVPEYKAATLGYAGRLDPMAEGVMLILVGDENKNRKQYERFKKEYEFQILFGLESDSYDVMGMLKNVNIRQFDIKSKLPDVLHRFIGKRIQPYPPYSAARVNGKPLFYWARENKIDQVQIPQKEIEIYSLELISVKQVSLPIIFAEVERRIKKVQGIFRQDEILARWNLCMAQNNNAEISLATCKITCSSGTYVRSIAHEMGALLRCGALTYCIKRTKVGHYSLEDSILIST